MSSKKMIRTTIFLIALIATLPFVLAATQSLTYDANGNLVTGDGKYREYNGFNKLVRVRNGSLSTSPILENYTWHPTEERVLIKDVYNNGVWNESVYYVSKTFVRIVNSSGSFDTKYIYQNGQLVAQENYDGSKIFLHSDHLGSTTLVTNESGSVVERTEYAPFGEIISGGATSRYDYEGKEYDSVVGDYDFHARRVKPEWGKPIQPDTIIADVYNPQNLNRYSFELNNPYKYTDPDGKSVVAAVLLIAAVVVPVTYLAMASGYSDMARDAPTAEMGTEFQQKQEERFSQMVFSAGTSITFGAAGSLATAAGSALGILSQVGESSYSTYKVGGYYLQFDEDLNRFAEEKYGMSYGELAVEEMKRLLEEWKNREGSKLKEVQNTPIVQSSTGGFPLLKAPSSSSTSKESTKLAYSRGSSSSSGRSMSESGLRATIWRRTWSAIVSMFERASSKSS